MKIKEKIFSKYTLYVLCFVILNFFDAIRDMQFASLQINNGYIRLEDVLPGYKMGDIWLIISNATGILMMLIVLSGYNLKKFLTKTNLVWTGLCVVAMVVWPYMRTGQNGTILVQEEIAIINVWWIILVAKQIIMKALKTKKSPIKFNLIVCLWIAITLCMFFSVAKSHIWPVFYLGMFGTFYLTEYKKEDIVSLFNAMMDGSILAFVLMQTVACLLRPYDTIRYEMLYTDCNMAASYYLIIYVMFLAKLHVLYMNKAKGWKRLACVVGQGSTLVLMFMTGCRMVLVTAVLVTILYGIVAVRKLWQKKWINVFLRGIILVVITLVMLYPTYLIIRWVPTVIPARLWYYEEFERLESEVLLGDSKYSDKYVDIEELFEVQLIRFRSMFPKHEKESTMSSEIKRDYWSGEAVIVCAVPIDLGKSVYLASISISDSSLNDRMSIYKLYYDKLTWFGNAPTELENYEMRYHAHTLYLQIAYLYGIPAGILLVVIAICLVVGHWRNVLTENINPYAIIPFMICVIFFGSGIMNVVWNTGQLMLFLVFFTQYSFRNNKNCIEMIEEK